MTVSRLCTMEMCFKTSRSQRRINKQVVLDIIIWCAVGIANLYIYLAAAPYHRGFFCDDRSIQLPYKPDTISTPVLIILGFTTSLVVVLLVEALNYLSRKCRPNAKPSEHCISAIKCYAVFLVGFALQQMIVESVKNTTGFLRPNFIDVCRPKYNTSLCPGYISEYHCTGNSSAEAVRRARQAFPSGHSSFSMFIAVYFCLYIQHRLHVSFSRILKICLQMALLLASTMCGFRRITDHKHHFSDVIVGFFIGAIVAIFMYVTLARHIMTSCFKEEEEEEEDEDKDQLGDSEDQAPCYTCNSVISDPATPTPLLSAEYTNSNSNGHPLKGIHLNVPHTETSVDS